MKARVAVAAAVVTLVAGCLGGAPEAPGTLVYPCQSEDGSGGPLPCYWDAEIMGNGVGRSFVLWSDGSITYSDQGE